MEELLKFRTRGLGSRIGEMIICPIYANLPSDLQARDERWGMVAAQYPLLPSRMHPYP